jgi:hypothetical protein
MSRSSRLIPAAAIAILLAACGGTSENPIAPAGPSYDGGLPVTGGNRTPPDSTGFHSPTANAEGAPADTTGRGGLPVTGGN